MSTDITTSLDWTRQLQSLEEEEPGVPTEDGVWENIGIATRFTKNISKDHEEIGLLGTEDLHDDAELFNNNSFSLTWLLFDTRFLRYCTELRGGSGTIGRTNTLMQTMLVGGEQKTRLVRGALCERVTIDVNKLPRITASFKCLSQSNWLTDAELEDEIGADFEPAPAVVSKPWTHRSAATTEPFSYGGAARDVKMITIDVNRNPAIKDPLGHIDPKSIRAGGRRIQNNITMWLEDEVIMDDVQNFTPKALDIKLHDTPDVFIAISNFKPNNYDQDNDVNSFDPLTEPISGTAAHISVDALTVEA
jgi:hypothetical protein